jgi:hypothetical protein
MRTVFAARPFQSTSRRQADLLLDRFVLKVADGGVAKLVARGRW